MKASMKDVFYHALLARAGYGLMETGDYSNIRDAITDKEKQSKMTSAMADYLVSKFKFVKVSNDGDFGIDVDVSYLPPPSVTVTPKADGYNGMIFKSETDNNHYVLVNRGTEFDFSDFGKLADNVKKILTNNEQEVEEVTLERFRSTVADLFSDAGLAMEGDNDQTDTMKEFLEKAKKDGIIPEGATITTTGHSLGGFLSSMAIKDDEMGISWAYGYNGAGYRPDANLIKKTLQAVEAIEAIQSIYNDYKEQTGKDLPKLEAVLDDPKLKFFMKNLAKIKAIISASYVGLNNLFDALGWKPLTTEGNMTNVLTEEGLDIVAGSGVKVGETSRITVDLPLGAGAIDQHGIIPLTDAFVYAYLLEAISHDHSLHSFNRAVKAFSLMPGDKLNALFEYLAKSFDKGLPNNKEEWDLEAKQGFLFNLIKDFEDTPSSNIKIYHLFNSDSQILTGNALTDNPDGILLRHALLNHSAITFGLASSYGDKSKLSKIFGNDSYSYNKFVVNEKEYDKESEYEFFKNLVAMSQMVYENNMMEKHGEISHEGGIFPYPYEDSGNRLYINHWRETENLQNPYVMFENVNTQIAYEKNGKNLNSYANGKYNVTFVGSHFGDTSTFVSNGDDRLYGLGGDDTLEGGEGNDYIDGGDDKDTLIGGLDADTLYGGAGNDTLIGGISEKTVQDNNAQNKLYGEAGDDTLKGSGRLEGGKDYDTYYAYDTATVRDEDGQGILYYHDKHLFGAEMMVESDSLTPPTKLDFTESGYDIKDTTTNRLKVVQRTDKYVRYRVTGDISFVYNKELTTDALSDKELGIQFFVTVHKKGYEPPPSFPTKMPPPAPPLPPPPPRDPLVLDLNGDGKISTLPKEKGVYFDLDNSGFAEKTAWVADGDGIVVWDKNNNGHIDGGYELFGTETLLKNNTLAPNGYVALAEHDNNGDGIINQLDSIYKNLQIWQDKNSNGLAESNELYTLSDLNIASISIVHTVHSQTDNNLVEHRERSQFTYKNGRTGLSETLWFNSDTVNSVPVAIHQGTTITINEDIQDLPDVVGFGNVYSLRHAMQLDSTGTLKALVERFISSEFDETEDKEAALLSLTHDIILHWTGQQNVDRGIYGDRFNAQHIEVMKKIWGQLPIDTSSETQLATVIPIYEQFANYVYTMLMAQSHLAGIYDQMHFYHDKTGEWTTDFEPVNQYVMTQVKNGIDHRQITQRVERFVHGLNPYTNRLLDAFKNSLESYKEQKGIIISTGTLTGDDRSNELYGSEHNDHFDGGLGDDFMMGYEGNDTYVVDSHNDVIVDNQGDNALIVKSQDGYTLSENHNIRNITIDQDAKGKVTTNNQDSIIVSHNENTQIDAKEGNNNIRVNLGGEILASNGSNTIHLGTGNYKVVLGDGNNLIVNDYRKQQNLDITLGDGNNNIKAQSANSTIIAGDGNNVIHLEGGNYHLMLGNGSNTVRIQEKFPFDHIAPEEPNQIQVGDGNNTIISELDGSVIATLGNGHNTLELQDGNHIINTGIGNNTISTKNGNQTITATGGNNTITFGNGTHHIKLADGNDLVTLGTGTHDVTLGDGNNQATTYGNDSHIKGGVHQDVLITGGSGNTLTGGEGADTFKVLLDSNNTIITDLQANDSLELSLRHTYLHEHLGSIYLGKRDVDTKSYYPFPKFKVARSTIGTNHELIEYSVGDKTGRFAQITYRPEGNGLSIEITQDNQRITIANFKNLTDIETIQALHNVSVKLNDGSRGGTYSHSPDIQRILKDYTSTSYILNESTISFKNLLDAGTIRAYYESGDNIINGLTDYNGNHYLAVYLDWSKADFENAPYVNVGDIIFAGAGNDTITTGMGSSIVFGEDGDDTIIASDAHASDIIHAGDGDDTIWVNSPQTRPEDSPSDSAEHKTDYIFAGAGNDIIHSQNKNQETKLEGGDGNDQIHMVAGIALGGSGSDIITANGNNAVKIYGESGNDTLTGGNHHDHLDGGEGDDRLSGGEGNDRLEGGIGADTLIGGNGDDTYIADTSDTYLEEGQDLEGGYDTIHINSDFDLSTNNFEAVTLLGDGNFNVIGDHFDNNIIGNTGNNRLFGGAGADYISAGEGDDHLDGGTDADTLVGGDGNDYYILDNEHDIITENFNQGIDTVEQWTDRYFYRTDEFGNRVKTASHMMLQDNIENLILKGETKTAFGNELDNIITLNTQNNFVNAMAGNDTIIYQKGGGKDTIANTDNIQNKDTLIIEGYDPSEAVFVRVKNTAGNDMLQIRFKNNPNDTITLLNYFAPTNTNELGTQQDNKIDEIVFRGQGADQVLTNTQFELLIIDQAKNTAPKANKHPKAINAEVGKVLSVQFDADTIKDTDAYDSQLKYKLTLATKDSNGQYEAIPDWLTFDPVTRTLTGTPPKGTNNQTITHQFILWGEDSFNYSAGVYVTLNIASQTTTPPAVTTPPTNPKPTTQEVPYLKDINNSRGINNTYLYSGGKYTLQDRSGTDTLRFANHIKASQITRSFSKSGNDLILKIDNQDKDTLIIKDFFTTQGRIERMVFGNGAALTYQQFYNAFGINTRTASTSGVSSIGIRSLSESWSTEQTHDHYIQNATNTLIQSMSLLPESKSMNVPPTPYQDQTIGQLWQVAISPV